MVLDIYFTIFPEGFLYVRLGMSMLESCAQKVGRNPITVTNLTDCHRAVSKEPQVIRQMN